VTSFTATTASASASSNTDTVTLRWSRLIGTPVSQPGPTFNFINIPGYFNLPSASSFEVQTFVGTAGADGVTNLEGITNVNAIDDTKTRRSSGTLSAEYDQLSGTGVLRRQGSPALTRTISPSPQKATGRPEFLRQARILSPSRNDNFRRSTIKLSRSQKPGDPCDCPSCRQRPAHRRIRRHRRRVRRRRRARRDQRLKPPVNHQGNRAHTPERCTILKQPAHVRDNRKQAHDHNSHDHSPNQWPEFARAPHQPLPYQGPLQLLIRSARPRPREPASRAQ